MQDTIRIQMMHTFMVYINERKAEGLVSKSKKGASLIQYLILNRGAPVPNVQLLETLWTDEDSANPESALKTLVSRTRALLNQISARLGDCIVSDRGAYHWELRPDMTIDLYDIYAILERLMTRQDDVTETKRLYEELLRLYRGDLLQNSELSEWILSRATQLHSDYISAVYAYLELLKSEKDYAKIVTVCRTALEVDNFDERLHMELITALIQTGRTSDALAQYKHIVHLNYRYLGVQPSDDMREFYKQIVRAGKTLEFNLDSIRSELREGGEQKGAFVCEYAVFKEIYNLERRSMERMDVAIFLAVIMIGDPNEPMDSLKQDNIMNGLLEIMRTNLRKGDIITRFSPTFYAVLLPQVNYTTGSMVMERIKRLFFQKYPNSTVPFNYCVGPIDDGAIVRQRRELRQNKGEEMRAEPDKNE